MASPLISGIASFIIPGLGQILNGKYLRGGALFGLWIVVTASVGFVSIGFFGIAHLVFIIASAIDAYRIAKSGLT